MSDITDFLAFRSHVMRGDFAGAVSITERVGKERASKYWETVNDEMAKALNAKHQAERRKQS